MKRVTIIVVTIGVATIAVWGCSGEKPVAETPSTVAVVMTQAAHSDGVADEAKLPADTDLDAAQVGLNDTTQQEATSEFKPPFPGNLDVFAPPRVERAAPLVQQTDKEQPVRLLGFVNLEGEKAILSFDGKVRSMSVGDVFDDVEVVTVEPPRVILQRNHKRWTMALFEQPIVHAASSSSSTFGDGRKVTIGSSSGGASRARSSSPFAPRPSSGNDMPLPGFPSPVDDLPGAPGLPGAGGESPGFGDLPGLDAGALPGLPTLP